MASSILWFQPDATKAVRRPSPAIQKNGKAVSTGSLRGFGDGEAITGMTNPAVKSP